LQELKKHQSLKGYTYFHVHTVDSYQGEENDVILLSLVRSNEHTGIGFLDNKNRLVVALSRARRGLYIFGNAVTLTNAESSEQVIGREALYYPLITFMKNGRRFDLDGGLPVACAKHGITTRIFEAEHWVGNAGGCGQPCGGLLDCAHPCPYPCHPFEHSSVLCQAPCGKQFPCGHGCSRVCSEKCICLQCDLDDENGNDIIDNRLLNLHLDNLWPDSDFLRDSPPRRSRDGAILGVQVSGSARVAFTGSPSKSRFTDVRNELRHRPGPSTPKKSTTPNNISPLKRFGQDASTPHRRGNMSNPSSGKKAISSPAVWSAWNAAEADQKVAERVEKERAESGPRVETVYKETYRPTKVKNGVRVFDPSGPIHSLVGPEKKVSGGDHKDLISFD
jgi:helicase required for RNAi-mediated heterochromatin assembly 1